MIHTKSSKHILYLQDFIVLVPPKSKQFFFYLIRQEREGKNDKHAFGHCGLDVLFI
jgi:hypothetical protein